MRSWPVLQPSPCSLWTVAWVRVAAVAVALLAFSRVYTAAHYPADVLVGLGLGIGVAVTGWLLVRGVLTNAVVRLATTRWRGLVTASPHPVAVS